MNTQVAVQNELTILAHEKESRAAVPRGAGIRVLSSPDQEVAENAHNLFVFSAATKLGDVADFVSISNSRHQLRALFVRDDLDPYWLPALFEKAGLRTLRNAIVHVDWTVPSRVIRAWRHGAQNRLVADARIANGMLYVTACDLERYEVPIRALPPLAKIPAVRLKQFQIDEDGSFLYWPSADIHINLEAIRYASDPAFRARSARTSSVRNERYGRAIERTRVRSGLTQNAIPGMSERQVRRIEKGAVVTERALTLLAKAHRMNVDRYLDALARESKRDGAEDAMPAHKATEIFPAQHAAIEFARTRTKHLKARH